MAMQLGNARPLFVGIPPFCSRLTCLQLMVRLLFQSQSLQNLSCKAVQVAGAGYHCQCHSQLILPLIERDSQQLAALASQWVPSDHIAVSSFTSVWPIALVGGFSFKRHLSKYMSCVDVTWTKFTEQCSPSFRSPIGPITVHPRLYQIAIGSSIPPALNSNGRKRLGFSFSPINSKTSLFPTSGMSMPRR